DIRRSYKMVPPDGDVLNVAFVTIDTEKPAQRPFVSALGKAGFAVKEVDFRSSFVSNPPSDNQRRKNPESLAPWIGYALGAISVNESRSALVVTHAFETWSLCHDFVIGRDRKCTGRAVMAFFRSA